MSADSRPRLGIALGGGGARALVHLGILEELEAMGIRPDVVTGTSMGGLIGAKYLCTDSAQATSLLFQETADSNLLNRLAFDYMFQRPASRWQRMRLGTRRATAYGAGLIGHSMVEMDDIAPVIETLLPNLRIEELARPFGCVAADLLQLKRFWWTDGPLRLAVASSSAIPGVFPPVRARQTLLSDGSWVEDTPIELARHLGATFVIGVQIAYHVDELRGGGVSYVFRSQAATRNVLRMAQARYADLLWQPNPGGLHWAAFGRVADAVKIGRAFVRERQDDLFSALKKHEQR